MAQKRVSFIITEENAAKMLQVTNNTGITQTEFINAACAEVPVLCIHNSMSLAAEFMKLRILLEEGDLSAEARKVGDEICQSLNVLTAEIRSFHR